MLRIVGLRRLDCPKWVTLVTRSSSSLRLSFYNQETWLIILLMTYSKENLLRDTLTFKIRRNETDYIKMENLVCLVRIF